MSLLWGVEERKREGGGGESQTISKKKTGIFVVTAVLSSPATTYLI
jgi:hypothetical protein